MASTAIAWHPSRPSAAVVRLLIIATTAFLLIALNNAYGFRLFAGGIVSVVTWLAVGQVLANHGSTVVTRALVGGWTGFVSAGANLLVREWFRVQGEVPGFDGNAGMHYLVAGVPTALLYWTALGALLCSVFGAFRATSVGRWIALLTLAFVGCAGAFAMAFTFMSLCGRCL
jgi:hypothetical protein